MIVRSNPLLLVVCFCFFTIHTLWSQVYEEKKSQHRFAQTYVGFNAQYTPSSGSVIFNEKTSAFPSQLQPRFTIGGVHFWGKFDFNMNLPLARFGDTDLGDGDYVIYNTGADLSARYYPWRLKYNKLRPFIGVGWNTVKVDLGNVALDERTEGFITTSLLSGLSFMYKGWRINGEVMYMPGNKRDFYSSLTQKDAIELPPFYFSLGVVKHFDFTLSEEKHKESGRTAAVEQALLKKGKLNSFSLGVAPNGSYFTQFEAFSGDLQSLPRQKGSFNWEFGLGYLFHRARMHVGFTYRNYSSHALSYNLHHIIRREALSLEAYRFLTDYNGFVPFVGVSLSGERWATGLFINDQQEGETVRTQLFSPGIIFGWDILPSPLETWVLRTNLRYYPMQKIQDVRGNTSRVDQFEFNFIQFVFYPNRWVHVRKQKRAYDQQNSL